MPRRTTLDIDNTFDAVHGGQQLRLFNAYYDAYGIQPIVVSDGSVAAFRSGQGKIEAADGETAPSGRGEAGRILQRGGNSPPR